MVSKITGGETELLFRARILMKYEIIYYRCKETGFIQTEEPYWLEEAYSSAITSLDLGLLNRNIHYSEKVSEILLNYFNPNSKFLDYAGGYGTFTRLMRDKGFNFYHTDKFCDNLFAKHFELDNAGTDKFEVLTAFELFEHLNDPNSEIEQMLKYSDTILFSTELVPDKPINQPSDWWYFSPETGQHISFYTISALKKIASHFLCNFYSDGTTLHLISKKSFPEDILTSKRDTFLVRKLKKSLAKLQPQKQRPSLLEKDWAYAKLKLNHIND